MFLLYSWVSLFGVEVGIERPHGTHSEKFTHDVCSLGLYLEGHGVLGPSKWVNDIWVLGVISLLTKSP